MRRETHGSANINFDQAHARNIRARNARSAFIIGPHSRHNGLVSIDGVKTVSCEFTGSAGIGYSNNNGDASGHFNPRSTIANVTAIFGMDTVLKSKKIKRLPCILQRIFPKLPDGKDYQRPSVGGVLFTDINIDVSNVDYELSKKCLQEQKVQY
ncbi:hypothetical protein ACXGQW_02100 [Wenyingzhuangia sp. IMCC45533]